MPAFKEADPKCNVKIEFSDNMGVIGGKLNCPITDKSDPKDTKPICAVEYLISQGYRVNIIEGRCPYGFKARGSDLDSMMN